MSRFIKQYKPNQNSSIDEKNRRSGHLTFFIFVLISAIFWLLIKLSQEYLQTYDMKIEYKDIPVDRLLTKKIDSTVKFNITARGFYLVELSLMHPDELIIHLDRYTIHKADGGINYISTLPLKDKIAKILDINPSDVSFSKSILSFLMEPLYSKKVDIISDINLKFEGSFNLYKPPVITPSKVMVFGPKAVLDTINEIKTRNISLDNVKESTVLIIGLLNPDAGILRLDPDKVNINLQVEKFTQSSFVVPVNTARSSYNIQTFPEKVTVYFTVALKDFERVKANDFLISPELNNIDLTSANKLHLEIKKHPDFVRNLRVDPKEVEFIIIK